MSINKKLFNCIIKHAKLICPNIRKPKYTHEYYLRNILDILTDFVKWSSLKKSKYIKSDYEYHYKTIAKIHKKWSDKGVYTNAHDELVKSKNLNINDKGVIVLFMDSSLMINKNGHDKIGYGGGMCRKKKYTKLTLASNIKGENVAVVVDDVYNKTIKNKCDENLSTIIETLSHDRNSMFDP